MEIVMPKMGESVNEGTILKWHKKVGESVKQDEIIFEISTDKVDTEIPSPVEGVLKEIKYNEGDTVDVGTVVAVIDDDGTNTVSEKNEETVKEKEIEAQQIVTEKKSEAKITSDNLVVIEMPKMGRNNFV